MIEEAQDIDKQYDDAFLESVGTPYSLWPILLLQRRCLFPAAFDCMHGPS